MKVEKLIPEVYYSQSRDFSYIGRLFEILFNYMRTGADCVSVKHDSPNIDATVIELVASTLGFESKHKYSTRDLIYIISSFSSLLRKKGSKDAINTAVQLLMNSQKIQMDELTDYVGSLTSEANPLMLNIKIPEQLTDLILLEDIFEYILPAGVLYTFTRVIPQPKKEITVSMELDNSYAYHINSDTSLIHADDGKVFILETANTEPDEWRTETPGVYYEYSQAEDKFIEIQYPKTYEPNHFYRRKASQDIGTIITGTVYNGG